MIKQATQWDIRPSGEREKHYIDQKLGEYHKAQLDFAGKWEIPLNYVIWDKGHIIAGINASLEFGQVLYVDRLFVEETYRNHGLGSLLLSKTENEAKAMGASLVHVDTFDFDACQARNFYVKHGYEIFAVLDDCPWPGHKRFYFKKVF